MKDLIGQKIEIQLHVFDAAMSYRRGPSPQPIPQLPVVQGVCTRKVLYPGERWAYLVQLEGPLLLDKEGIDEKSRRLYSTAHLLISPAGLEKDDHIFHRLEQRKLADTFVRAVKDTDALPNELSKDDPAWEYCPSISCGIVRLLP